MVSQSVGLGVASNRAVYNIFTIWSATFFGLAVTVTQAVNWTCYSDPENVHDVFRQGSVLISDFSKILYELLKL
jgi:hypothetical protein